MSQRKAADFDETKKEQIRSNAGAVKVTEDIETEEPIPAVFAADGGVVIPAHVKGSKIHRTIERGASAKVIDIDAGKRQKTLIDGRVDIDVEAKKKSQSETKGGIPAWLVTLGAVVVPGGLAIGVWYAWKKGAIGRLVSAARAFLS